MKTEKERQLDDGRGGRRPIIRRRESLVLYNTSNTLCAKVSLWDSSWTQLTGKTLTRVIWVNSEKWTLETGVTYIDKGRTEPEFCSIYIIPKWRELKSENHNSIFSMGDTRTAPTAIEFPRKRKSYNRTMQSAIDNCARRKGLIGYRSLGATKQG